MNRKKILFVITKSNWGGAQRYVFDLATNLPKSDFDVSVAVGGRGLLIPKLEAEKIPVIRIPALQRDISFIRELAAFLFLYRLCRDQKPDVVHLNSSKAGGLGALAARLAGVPKIVFTAHGWPFNENRNPVAKILIWLLSWLTALLCTDIIVIATPELHSAKRMPFIGKKTALIHNGIAPFPLLSRAEARNKLHIPESAFVVGTIAELHPNKNIPPLIEAAKDIPNASFYIISDGELMDSLQHQIDNLNLQNKVTLTGFIENARSLLFAFDMFILPSKKEGLPYVLLEAGVAGLPVIASNIGGIPDIIEHEKSGLLINPRIGNEITSSLQLLQNNSTLRNQLGTALNEKIQNNFTLANMLQKTSTVYGA